MCAIQFWFKTYLIALGVGHVTNRKKKWLHPSLDPHMEKQNNNLQRTNNMEKRHKFDDPRKHDTKEGVAIDQQTHKQQEQCLRVAATHASASMHAHVRHNMQKQC